MLSLSALSSTELSRLKETLKTDQAKIEFLGAVDRFLKAHPLDGGADSDTVYVVGRLLSSQRVWDEIPAYLFISHLSDIPVKSFDVFLRSDSEYLFKVRQHLSLDDLISNYEMRKVIGETRAELGYYEAVKLMISSDLQKSGLKSLTHGLKSTSYSVPKVVGTELDPLSMKMAILLELGGLIGPRHRSVFDVFQEPTHVAASRKKPHPVKQK